ADEPVAVLETDKANVDLPAPAGGVLRRAKEAGERVQVGETIARIDEAAPGTKPAASATKPAAAAATKPAQALTPAAPTAPVPAAAPASTGATSPKVGEATQGPTTFDATGTKRVPMSKIRKRIAERLVNAQNTAAILTTFNEIDLTEVMNLRAKYKDRFNEVY